MAFFRYLKYCSAIINFICFLNFSVFSQTENISGVINSYTWVSTVDAPDSTVTVDNVSLFQEGDTVLLIQMKGARIKPNGRVDKSSVGNAGKYEFHIISAINTNDITFSASLLNSYSIDGMTQLIRVPGYKNAIIDGELNCQDWNADDTTGGVLAFMVSDTLQFNNNINVAENGFKGAQPVESDGTCSESEQSYFGTMFLNESDTAVGRKGEGIVAYSVDSARSYARWGNGGGGGSGRFTGGGGGSNYSQGGVGGWESQNCGNPSYSSNDTLRGAGGFVETNVLTDSLIIMGGGGGSGTFDSDIGGSASTGGNGGGIVIIMANVIIGNNYTINANGESVTTVAKGSGAGGGAGGTVLLETNNFINSLTIQVNGGDGGDTDTTGIIDSTYIGAGGSGSGGVVRLSLSSTPGNVTVEVESGGKGESSVLPKFPREIAGATTGFNGTTKYNLRIPIRGFLYNSILDNQTICWSTAPETLIGSDPRGGTGTYTYTWQSSLDSSAWSSASGTQRDYSPGVLTDTIYYRRIVESGTYKDTSNVVKITVQPAITGNTILDQDTICSGSIPKFFDGSNSLDSLSGGDGIFYTFQWIYSNNQSSWGIITDSTREDFAPGPLTDTTYYHRLVSSGACIDTSNQGWVTVLELIGNNVISSAQTICEGQEFSILNGNPPNNGDGEYSYKWESSTDNVDWQDTLISNSSQNYLPLSESTYYPGLVSYRRIVYSGYNNCCKDTSNVLDLRVWPEIKNNVILDDQTVCYGTSPTNFTSDTVDDLTDGSGSYTFVWESSLNDASWSATSGVNEDYQSGNLTQNTYFRRIVNSSACSDTSASIFVDIYPLPIANISPLRDTICSGSSIELTFNISGDNPPWDLTYTDGAVSTILTDISSLHNINVNPATESEEEEYHFLIESVIDSRNCEATDITGVDTIIVYGLPDANAGEDDSICGLVYTLNPVPSVGNGLWTTTTDAEFDDSTQSNSNVFAEKYGVWTFIWTETNWECSPSSDNVKIKFFEEPQQPVAGKDTIIFFNDSITLRASTPSAGIGTWTLVEGTGSITNTNDSISKMTDLIQGDNIFRWTVSNGICPEHFDELIVSVHDIEPPTGFSPNGDGLNDNLTINGLQDNPKVESCKFIVYNGWGNEVFKTTHKDFEWDGTYNNKSGEDLPEGTYYYILEVNGTHSYKGYFVIKRK